MDDARTGVAQHASTATLAARTLAQRRWGGTRVRNLVHELRERADELDAEQVDQLRSLVDGAGATMTTEERV